MHATWVAKLVVALALARIDCLEKPAPAALRPATAPSQKRHWQMRPRHGSTSNHSAQKEVVAAPNASVAAAAAGAQVSLISHDEGVATEGQSNSSIHSDDHHGTAVLASGPDGFKADATPVHKKEFRIVCIFTIVLLVLFALGAVCSGLDPTPSSPWVRVRHPNLDHSSRPLFCKGSNGLATAPPTFSGTLGVPRPQAVPSRAAMQLLIDLDALRRGAWPLNLTGLDGKVAFRAALGVAASDQTEGSVARTAIELYTANDPSAPQSVITSDLVLCDSWRNPYARLRMSKPSRYVMEAYTTVSGQQKEVVFSTEQNGVLVATLKGQDTPLATAAPVWYLRECLEVALGPGTQSMTASLVVAVLGIIVFQAERPVLRQNTGTRRLSAF